MSYRARISNQFRLYEADDLEDALDGVGIAADAEIAALRQRAEAAKAEVARLRADEARIDWIGLQYLDDLMMHLVVDAEHDGDYYVCGDDGKSGYGPTLRAAIDAARGAA